VAETFIEKRNSMKVFAIPHFELPKNSVFWWRLSIFFGAAILFALVVHWIRQAPPTAASTGWAYQQVEMLDQAGDLYHALELLPNALAEASSKQAAEDFLKAVETRKKQAPSASTQIVSQLQTTELKFIIPRLLFNKGVIADLMQDNLDAIRWYKAALEKKPGMSIAYVRLALVHERMGELEKAEGYFLKALSIQSRAPLTRFHYGMFLTRSVVRPQDALKEAQFLEKVRPAYSRMIIEQLKGE
jgi:tetratricopeptide (TPR) repeat protein